MAPALQAWVPSHNWEKYDFGGGPQVKDRLYQGPFPQYEPEAFYDACRGHEADPEGGPRCKLCFRMRLGATAKLARKLGSDYFTTTLTISPLKDAQLLNAIGAELSRAEGVPWLYSDFKKKNGYKRSCELSREYGLYRQDYCGCVFSKRESDARMAKTE